MPKLILRCNYLKNAPSAHLQNYINHVGTREGVEKVDSTTALLPSTGRQKELIQDILYQIPDTKRMHEYTITSRILPERTLPNLLRRH